VIQSSTLLPLAIFSNLSQLSTHGEYSSSGGDGDGGGGDAAAATRRRRRGGEGGSAGEYEDDVRAHLG